MSLTPSRLPATRASLRIFGALLALVAGLLYWLVSVVARREHRERAGVGLGLPLCLALVAGLARLGVPKQPLAIVVGVLVLGIAVTALLWLRFAHALRDAWMEAVAPMGWSVSNLVLASTYFLVLTPIGWLLRRTGRDPLSLRRDVNRKTYWVDHETPADIRRYFRQF
jgi:hypothetical protein